MTHSILDSYLHFRDDGRADTVPVSASFWQELVGGQREERKFQLQAAWDKVFWMGRPVGPEGTGWFQLQAAWDKVCWLVDSAKKKKLRGFSCRLLGIRSAGRATCALLTWTPSFSCRLLGIRSAGG